MFESLYNLLNVKLLQLNLNGQIKFQVSDSERLHPGRHPGDRRRYLGRPCLRGRDDDLLTQGDPDYILKCGHLRPLFRYFQTILLNKNCRLGWIQTRIVEKESEHDNHFTTTTAHRITFLCQFTQRPFFIL